MSPEMKPMHVYPELQVQLLLECCPTKTLGQTADSWSHLPAAVMHDIHCWVLLDFLELPTSTVPLQILSSFFMNQELGESSHCYLSFLHYDLSSPLVCRFQVFCQILRGPQRSTSLLCFSNKLLFSRIWIPNLGETGLLLLVALPCSQESHMSAVKAYSTTEKAQLRKLLYPAWKF